MTEKTAPTKPTVVTCGDPSGIGPEISVKAWQEAEECRSFVTIGDLDQFAELCHAASIPYCPIDSPAGFRQDKFCILPHEMAEQPIVGKPHGTNAKDTIAVIQQAVEYVRTGQASAVVTNPINKDVLRRGADFPFPGHTEFLAHLDGKDRSVMMLASRELRVVPVTIHIPLNDVNGRLTPDLLRETIQTTHSSLVRDFGIQSPRIAVAGLNPHAGENGQMGDEETKVIGPIIAELQNEGLNLVGPLSADTMFHKAARSNYDAAVCMYHDQALIPIKTLDFDRGVNVTLGLSFVRTSPDHGTAFDIAGKGVANPQSLIEAIKLATEIANHRAGL